MHGELWGPWVPGRLTRQPLAAAHVQGPSLGVIGWGLLSLAPADEKCQMTLGSRVQGRKLKKDKKSSCSHCVSWNNPTPWWGEGARRRNNLEEGQVAEAGAGSCKGFPHAIAATLSSPSSPLPGGRAYYVQSTYTLYHFKTSR